MRILERAIMPDGTKIQLEDWNESNTESYPNLYGLTIGAYPQARNSSKWRLIERGKIFRLTICYNNHTGYLDSDVRADYEALKVGSKTLMELANHYANAEKDCYYMGLSDNKTNQ